MYKYISHRRRQAQAASEIWKTFIRLYADELNTFQTPPPMFLHLALTLFHSLIISWVFGSQHLRFTRHVCCCPLKIRCSTRRERGKKPIFFDNNAVNATPKRTEIQLFYYYQYGGNIKMKLYYLISPSTINPPSP